MASDFSKDVLDVERHYTRNWFTNWVATRLLKYDLKHHTPHSYNLSRWLLGFANLVRSASPRDGYEWVDRRTSLFSRLDVEQQAELLAGSLRSEDGKSGEKSSVSKASPRDTKESTK